MAAKKPSALLNRLLMREAGYTQELRETRAAKKLQGVRADILAHLQEVSQSKDLSLIVATERSMVKNDLALYTNSLSMARSLNTAINEITAIERHVSIVEDYARYHAVDQAHSLPRNRKKGLPFDEARQALASHHTRLNNLDKSRLGDDEKQLIEVRKSAMFSAGKLYAARQAKTLSADHLNSGEKTA